VRAPLTGGNLSLLAHSIGTPFEVEARGRILFVEEVNEAPYRIDRMVRQLSLAGVFRGIRGLLIGRFTGCGGGKKAEGVLLEAVEGRKIPVAAGFPVGHGSVNRPFPLGVPAVLDTTARSLTFAPFFPAQTPRAKTGKSRRGLTH
jgi:muramoyltetrapeptide carboxypeptidase